MSDGENPWTVLDSRPVYDNPWIGVTEHQAVGPASLSPKRNIAACTGNDDPTYKITGHI